jgi:hypothetical protein
MTDFINSFNKGLSEAENAQKNRAEINATIEELSKQLERTSGGKLLVSVKGFKEAVPFASLLGSALTGYSDAKKYQAICATNPLAESPTETELARWAIGRAGYPCTIKLGTDEWICGDKNALEQYLKYLLQDPIVGEKLFAVMNQKLKSI